jgi:hypothetical protein
VRRSSGRSRARAAFVAAPVATLLIAGCGGGSELSGKQLRARATRVCAAASLQTDRIPTPSSPAVGAAFLERGIAVLEPEYRQLAALHPPSDLAQVYSIPVGTYPRKLDALKTAARRLRHGADPAITMKSLEHKLAPLQTSEEGAWRALEVPACADA